MIVSYGLPKIGSLLMEGSLMRHYGNGNNLATFIVLGLVGVVGCWMASLAGLF